MYSNLPICVLARATSTQIGSLEGSTFLTELSEIYTSKGPLVLVS